MKALTQGNDDQNNKRLVDKYWETNELFNNKFPAYARYKGNEIWNYANLSSKTYEDAKKRSKWSIVRKNVRKTKTWISRLSSGYVNF